MQTGLIPPDLGVLIRLQGSLSNTCFINFLVTWPPAAFIFNRRNTPDSFCNIHALICCHTAPLTAATNIPCHLRCSHFSPRAIRFAVIAVPVQSLRWIAPAHMAAAVHSCIVRVYGDWVIRLPAVIRQSGSEVQYVPDDCCVHTSKQAERIKYERDYWTTTD